MKIHVTAVLGEGYEITTSAGKHKIESDVPESLGGKDHAPDPEELFLASLASCKLITMKMVAQHKLWDTNGMSLTLSMQREEKKTIIHQTISFPGNLTVEQQDKLREISHKCPVARIVTGEVEISDAV